MIAALSLLCILVPEIEVRLREALPGRGRQSMAESIAGATNGFALAPTLSEDVKKVKACPLHTSTGPKVLRSVREVSCLHKSARRRIAQSSNCTCVCMCVRCKPLIHPALLCLLHRGRNADVCMCVCVCVCVCVCIQELAWSSASLIKNTNTCGVMLVEGGRVVMARGALPSTAYQPGKATQTLDALTEV